MRTVYLCLHVQAHTRIGVSLPSRSESMALDLALAQ